MGDSSENQKDMSAEMCYLGHKSLSVVRRSKMSVKLRFFIIRLYRMFAGIKLFVHLSKSRL